MRSLKPPFSPAGMQARVQVSECSETPKLRTFSLTTRRFSARSRQCALLVAGRRRLSTAVFAEGSPSIRRIRRWTLPTVGRTTLWLPFAGSRKRSRSNMRTIRPSPLEIERCGPFEPHPLERKIHCVGTKRVRPDVNPPSLRSGLVKAWCASHSTSVDLHRLPAVCATHP